MKQNRIKQVRLDMGLQVNEMAELMGVSPSTVSNWEGGRFPVPEKKLPRMAEISGCSIAYLRGEDTAQINWTKPIAQDSIPALHRSPVWCEGYGWGLVNAVSKTITLTDGSVLHLQDLTATLYGIPPAFTVSLFGYGAPLSLGKLKNTQTAWVEPISTDATLREELRGWYHAKSDRFFENEYGQRFYVDTYMAKWIAFEDIPDPGTEINNKG